MYVLTLGMSCHLMFCVSGYDDYVQGDVYPLGQRIVLCFYSLFNYLYYWMLPFHLDWLYSYPVGLHESLPWWLFLYPLLLLVVVCAAWGRVKGSAAAYMLSFFLVHLLFVIHLIVLPRDGVIADRYMYLPILGLSTLLAYYLTAWPWAAVHQRVSCVLFAAVLLLLSVLSYERTSDWQDSRTLKKEAIGQCAARQYHQMPASVGVLLTKTYFVYETFQVCGRAACLCRPDSPQLRPVRDALSVGHHGEQFVQHAINIYFGQVHVQHQGDRFFLQQFLI